MKSITPNNIGFVDPILFNMLAILGSVNESIVHISFNHMKSMQSLQAPLDFFVKVGYEYFEARDGRMTPAFLSFAINYSMAFCFSVLIFLPPLVDSRSITS